VGDDGGVTPVDAHRLMSRGARVLVRRLEVDFCRTSSMTCRPV
jgi:hypothetical protein